MKDIMDQYYREHNELVFHYLCQLTGHRDLAEEMRDVIYLRLSGDLSFAEIGEIVNKTENWARVTYYRAKQQLMKGGSL